jgi:hypothetical protein
MVLNYKIIVLILIYISISTAQIKKNYSIDQWRDLIKDTPIAFSGSGGSLFDDDSSGKEFFEIFEYTAMHYNRTDEFETSEEKQLKEEINKKRKETIGKTFLFRCFFTKKYGFPRFNFDKMAFPIYFNRRFYYRPNWQKGGTHL